MRYKHHGQMRRYLAYRSEHFLPEEARELSKLRRTDYRELRPMVQERRMLWRGFKEDATQAGWSPSRQARTWKNYVKTWYVREGHTSNRIGLRRLFAEEKEVWIWFNHISDELPEEKRYPRNARHHSKMSTEERESRARHEADKALHDRYIDGLMKTVIKSPERNERLTIQAQRLGFTGKSLYHTALRRGYK